MERRNDQPRYNVIFRFPLFRRCKQNLFSFKTFLPIASHKTLFFPKPRSCTQVKNVVWNSLRVGIDFRQLSSLHFLLLRLSQTIENNVFQCAKCKIPFGIGKQKKIIQSNEIYRILLLLCAMWNNSRGCFTQWQWHVAPCSWLFLVNWKLIWGGIHKKKYTVAVYRELVLLIWCNIPILATWNKHSFIHSGFFVICSYNMTNILFIAQEIVRIISEVLKSHYLQGHSLILKWKWNLRSVHNVTTFVFLQSLIWSLIQIKSMWFLAFKGFSSLSFFFLFFSFPLHTFSFLSFIFLPFSFLYSPLRFYFTSEWRKMIVKIHIDFVRSDIHSIVNRLLFLKIFLREFGEYTDYIWLVKVSYPIKNVSLSIRHRNWNLRKRKSIIDCNMHFPDKNTPLPVLNESFAWLHSIDFIHFERLKNLLQFVHPSYGVTYLKTYRMCESNSFSYI